jgi:hypothetical protein
VIPQDDLKPGMYVAIRFARTSPTDDVWDHVQSPRVWKVLSVSPPYVAAECLMTGQKRALDAAAYEFEHLRVEFVRALFPEKFDKPAAALTRAAQTKDEERDRDGYPKPIRLMSIDPSGRCQR